MELQWLHKGPITEFDAGTLRDHKDIGRDFGLLALLLETSAARIGR
jgi:hypothetical protein